MLASSLSFGSALLILSLASFPRQSHIPPTGPGHIPSQPTSLLDPEAQLSCFSLCPLGISPTRAIYSQRRLGISWTQEPSRSSRLLSSCSAPSARDWTVVVQICSATALPTQRHEHRCTSHLGTFLCFFLFAADSTTLQGSTARWHPVTAPIICLPFQVGPPLL